MRILRTVGELILELLALVGIVAGGLLMFTGGIAVIAGLLGAQDAQTNLDFIRFGSAR